METLRLDGDADPLETQEWMDAIDSVIEFEGADRAVRLLEASIARAHEHGADLPFTANTPYLNTIPVSEQAASPGDHQLEWRIRCVSRWNAMAQVLRANKESSELGGHIASYASSATLYDVGFNHFWHAPSKDHGGDLIFVQGHVAPGIYSRAFLLGRLTKEQMDNFRQETGGNGLSSYPHPYLMPDFWQFPTVSMGLGPLMAIYQARFMKYLHHRGMANTENRKVWAFLGDGEMDEPESLGAISLASRENLDNLVFVVNCNLQRLDGPVRGNGKIIQELERVFRGAGWNVIKVIWGSLWDPLLERDHTGALRRVMNTTVDGEYQAFKRKGGAYTRENFFAKDPDALKLIEGMTDEQVWQLNRGGHDPHKVYAAYRRAVETKGQPTVILAKTVKGYGMGEAGEGQNITHQQKKMGADALRSFRDRFDIPVSDKELGDIPYVTFDKGSPELEYMKARREKLGGYLPKRRRKTSVELQAPALSAFDAQLKDTGDREISTTMAFVRILNTLCRNKQIGKHIVPIVPDESRTFGMEGMFRQLGIYNPKGQLYKPEDADQLMYYKESIDGQVLQEGINEAGAMSDWIAAATSYSTHDVPIIPFYIYYSMFGFQRVGDLAWAAGDSRARGFLIGGTSGRTTLNGEGLQHEDGHSHILAQTIPNCVSYDPTYSYEVAVIVQDGLRRMLEEQEDIYYYITVLNENYHHPALPEGVDEHIKKGLYLLKPADEPKGRRKQTKVRLLGSGSILREVIAGADLLKQDFGVDADIYSAPSFNLLARDGQEVERWNMLHPGEEPRKAHVTELLDGSDAPVIVSTDYMRLYAEQVRAYVPARCVVLGTDGFGRSDYRKALRRHFEVDRYQVAVAALSALAAEGKIDRKTVGEAIARYGIDTEKTYALYA
ncbi:MAG: pyruvate dehydrogenase (acetyl-transferring), homodimeric type [Geminicoccaceae bacterium]